MTDNPFEAFASGQMVSATKAKWRAYDKRQASKVKIYRSATDAPLVLTGLEKKQADVSSQLRRWRRWRRAIWKGHMRGPHRAQWLELSSLLRHLSFDNSGMLLDYLAAARWLLDADAATKQAALSMISAAIVRLRTRNGYPPFDDALPGEPPTAYEIAREILTTHHNKKASHTHDHYQQGARRLRQSASRVGR
jgi:hypothetical protein